MHPAWRRCSSVTDSPVRSLLAPCHTGASPPMRRSMPDRRPENRGVKVRRKSPESQPPLYPHYGHQNRNRRLNLTMSARFSSSGNRRRNVSRCSLYTTKSSLPGWYSQRSLTLADTA